MSKNEEKIKKKIAEFGNIKEIYIKSDRFKEVADNALENFIKRVRRGLMPDLGAIPKLESKEYIKLRKLFSFQLGELGKVNKSNATATGQMLEAMAKEITSTGFQLMVKPSSRAGELGDRKVKLNNKQVADYYRKNREIFDWSKPEIERIVREIKRDLLKLIRSVK